MGPSNRARDAPGIDPREKQAPICRSVTATFMRLRRAIRRGDSLVLAIFAGIYRVILHPASPDDLFSDSCRSLHTIRFPNVVRAAEYRARFISGPRTSFGNGYRNGGRIAASPRVQSATESGAACVPVYLTSSASGAGARGFASRQ